MNGNIKNGLEKISHNVELTDEELMKVSGGSWYTIMECTC